MSAAPLAEPVMICGFVVESVDGAELRKALGIQTPSEWLRGHLKDVVIDDPVVLERFRRLLQT